MTWEFDVVEFDADDGLKLGDTAPDLSRPLVGDDHWRDVSLSSLASDDSMLLLFHSMNGSWPAIFLWQELRDRGWHEAYDVEIVGVTISTPYSCWEFREQWSVPYRLYSDPQNDLAEAFGVDTSEGYTERVTFVLANGEVTHAYEGVKPDGHARNVLEDILDDGLATLD